jgi:DNA-binding FadR family transcriptional regulator
LKTPVKAIIPQIRLDGRATVAMQRQLYESLRHIILHGRLGFGVCLPSTRRLAKALGVSRNAVLFAYEELAAEGLLNGRRGSGTHVEAETGFSFLDPDGQVLDCLGGAPASARDLRRILRDAQVKKKIVVQAAGVDQPGGIANS